MKKVTVLFPIAESARSSSLSWRSLGLLTSQKSHQDLTGRFFIWRDFITATTMMNDLTQTWCPKCFGKICWNFCDILSDILECLEKILILTILFKLGWFSRHLFTCFSNNGSGKLLWVMVWIGFGYPLWTPFSPQLSRLRCLQWIAGGKKDTNLMCLFGWLAYHRNLRSYSGIAWGSMAFIQVSWWLIITYLIGPYFLGGALKGTRRFPRGEILQKSLSPHFWHCVIQFDLRMQLGGHWNRQLLGCPAGSDRNDRDRKFPGCIQPTYKGVIIDPFTTYQQYIPVVFRKVSRHTSWRSVWETTRLRRGFLWWCFLSCCTLW